MPFKYTLEKYTGPQSRYICPRCGKKTFVRYIDTTTGTHLDSQIGRCNREIKCGYHEPPGKNKVVEFNIHEIAIQRTSFITARYINYTTKDYEKNSFITGLEKLFDQSKITSLVELYYIGTISTDVVFWQIDQFWRVRTGKIMKYDYETLKRQGNPSWVHRYFQLKDFKLNQCLFGLHLRNYVKNGSPIFIVESEKTAIIMSGFFPEYIWMATGSLQNLSKVRLTPLNKHNIFLFPDIGAERIWAKKTIGLNNVKIINWAKVMNIDKTEHQGADLADFLDRVESIPIPHFNIGKQLK